MTKEKQNEYENNRKYKKNHRGLMGILNVLGDILIGTSEDAKSEEEFKKLGLNGAKGAEEAHNKFINADTLDYDSSAIKNKKSTYKPQKSPIPTQDTSVRNKIRNDEQRTK